MFSNKYIHFIYIIMKSAQFRAKYIAKVLLEDIRGYQAISINNVVIQSQTLIFIYKKLIFLNGLSYKR